MKKFRFKYPVIVWILLAAVLLLSVAGLCWNIFNLISVMPNDVLKQVLYGVIVALNGALVVLTVSVGVYGTYVIKGENLYSYFGFIRTKYEIKDIVEITHFKKTDKLVVYFKDEKYTVIVISPELYDDFVLAIREINKQIVYDKKIEGENTPD